MEATVGDAVGTSVTVDPMAKEGCSAFVDEEALGMQQLESIPYLPLKLKVALPSARVLAGCLLAQ